MCDHVLIVFGLYLNWMEKKAARLPPAHPPAQGGDFRYMDVISCVGKLKRVPKKP